MNVSLTPELEELVRKKVASGQYSSSSEVVRQALRLLDRHDTEYEEKLEALRAAIREGMKGPFLPFNEDTLKEISGRGRKRLAELRAKDR